MLRGERRASAWAAACGPRPRSYSARRKAGVTREERRLRRSRARAAPGGPTARAPRRRARRAAAPAAHGARRSLPRRTVAFAKRGRCAARCRRRAGPRPRAPPAPSRNGLSRRAARRASESAICASAVGSLARSRTVASSWTKSGRRRELDLGLALAARERPDVLGGGARPLPRERRRSASATCPSVSKPARASAVSTCGGRSRSETGSGRHERALVPGQHHEQAARLGPARGDPRGEARRGEAERRVEAEPALQLVADRLGRAHGRDGAVRLGAEVDEGLVGGGPLDAAARGEQHRGHLLADATVGRRGRRAGRPPPARGGGPAAAPCRRGRPSGRASSLAAATKPMPEPSPPITTGRPRSEGSRLRSTETKNGSRSTCSTKRRLSLTRPV